jgi:predicted AlkP superfamily phosphohydrolase/phosphomutase
MTHWGLFAYIGPGAGFAFLGSFLSLVLAVLAGIASVVVWPFRMAWALIVARRRTEVGKVIFLGFDGLDPVITEKLMAERKLPNFARLRDQGSYRRLRTTFPAISPVAWSTFATGVNPAKHNIFDFLSRDLRTYAPELSSAKVWPATRFLRLGKWSFPLSRAAVEMRRKSEPFWKILGAHAVRSTILRVPVTFPPEAFNGRELSAMCTPDLLGTQGTYSRFTAAEGALAGPEGTRVPFQVQDARIEIQGGSYPLAIGEYTPWIRLKFGRAHGIVRFLLTQCEPEIDLYATPVQIDPGKSRFAHQPSAVLCHLSGEVTRHLCHTGPGGRYLGTQRRRDRRRRVSPPGGTHPKGAGGDVLQRARTNPPRRGGLCLRYHRSGAAYVSRAARRDRTALLRHGPNRGRDACLRRRDTALFVLSDHGFCAFRRGVNLNSWLLIEGYLTLDAGLTSSGEYLEGIDWTKTRAYTFGLGGLYLNLRGREAHGIVSKEEAVELRDELVRRLTGLIDEETGDIAIQSVYRASDIYRGPYLNAAPDLIVGYAPGYRASWDAATGKVTSAIFEDNRKAWRGDHCVDPPLVPGVLFSNLEITAADPGIEDMAPTALSLFGVEAPAWMEGKPVIATA